MNAWGAKYPKSALLEAYQLYGGTPLFDVDHSREQSPFYTCQLTIPAVHTPEGGFPESCFVATFRSKKGAEHSAAEMALCFIASRGLLPAPFNAPARHAQTLSGCLPRVVADEVQELQQRLDVLSIQLGKAATSNGRHPRSGGPSIPLKHSSKAPSKVVTADAERLSLDQLRAALREALQENDQLRRELLTEQQRRQVAITALTSQPA